MFNNTASSKKSPSCDVFPHLPTYAVVATFAPFPESRYILERLANYAVGNGYEVIARVAIDEADPDDDHPELWKGRWITPDNSPGQIRVLPSGAKRIITDRFLPSDARRLTATMWRQDLDGVPIEVVDLERLETAASVGSATPVVGPTQTSSSWIFEQYAREVAGPEWENLKVKERPEELKTLFKVREKFINAFPIVPMDWPPIRDWLYTTWPGESRRTRRNMFDVLKRTFTYAVGPLQALPHNPLDGAPRPKAKSRPSTPLSEELLIRCHDRAMEKSLRDFCIWLLRFAQGWRPVECTRLLAGQVRQAVAKSDGYIMREQKHRTGTVERSVSPIHPLVLEQLRLLEETLPDLADDEPIFRSEKGTGRHQGQPLEAQGVRNVIRSIFNEAGVRAEIPDVIPYDLRDSFAAYVGRTIVKEGGSVWVAEKVTSGLLGHGDGADSLKRYWDDDLRHLELEKYSPLRLVEKNGAVPAENGGVPAEIGGLLVEIGGLEPPTSALRTPRSPS